MAVPSLSPSLKPVASTAPPGAANPRRRPRRTFLSLLAPAAFLGIHLAAFSVFFVPTTWTAVGLCVAFYALRVFGLTAGYHRYFAHRGYKATRWFQFVLAWLGASALQRGPIWWAGHHRLHHKHSDTEDDPHSPVVRSVWWAHIGWVLSPQSSATGWDQMKDWKHYPELRLLEKYDVVPGVLLAVACYLIGGLSGLAWGFLLSTVLVYHVTFLVNSACHLFGKRRYATQDDSRNNWLVALLTFGEGWHNNHHHYPSAARQGFMWWEVDVSYSVLKVLSWFGVVWDLREPTPRALAKNPAVPTQTGK